MFKRKLTDTRLLEYANHVTKKLGFKSYFINRESEENATVEFFDHKGDTSVLTQIWSNGKEDPVFVEGQDPFWDEDNGFHYQPNRVAITVRDMRPVETRGDVLNPELEPKQVNRTRLTITQIYANIMVYKRTSKSCSDFVFI